MTMTLRTQLVTVDAKNLHPDTVRWAADIIRSGGLVAFPTETVYGLGADALNAEAVARIFAAKGRPAHDPIIVHVADITGLERVASRIPPLAYRLAEHFWPGPLTLVLPKAEIVPDVVTAGGPTVAVRCPDHPLALALIRAAGTPIAAPSANRFSHTSPTTAQHVWDDLAGRIELILDGGPTPIGVESTVLDMTEETPVVLRPGGVPVEALAAMIGAVAQRNRTRSAAYLPSPGLLERHYAPRAELRLFSGAPEAVWTAMQEEIKRASTQGRTVGLLLADEDLPALASTAGIAVSVGSILHLEQVAQRLFGALRSLDAAGVDLILARDFPSHGLGLAIRDRLRRAARIVVDV